jgi:hypothetical protein
MKSHEEERRGKGGVLMMCCNVTHCNNCTTKSIEFMSKDESKNVKCFNCREPVHNATFWAKTIEPNDDRCYMLSAIGPYYMKGINE